MHLALRTTVSNVSAFARRHDDLPAFNAAYWVLTFLAAMLFNAGAFAVLIGGHIALDVYKYRTAHRQPWRRVASGVFHENILDVSLLSLGIAFGVYFHASVPLVAGVRGLLRTEISIINALVQVTVKAHILHNILMVLSHLYQYLERMHPRVGKGANLLERIAYVGLICAVVFIVASPWILGLDAEHIAELSGDLLIPWRM